MGQVRTWRPMTADGGVEITAVQLHDDVRAEIVKDARTEAPNECCGLLIGSGTLIDESVRARNVDANPATRYEVDPQVHVAAIRRLRGSSRAVVGCYHSHPHSPPVPSPSDVAEAWYPDFIWIIVSLEAAEAQLAAYRILSGRFVRLSLSGL
jgi:proteasome lid subunit RPN8/RPN11